MKSSTKKIRKKSVALAEPNIAWADAEADRLGISFSEVVRKAMQDAQDKQERAAKRK